MQLKNILFITFIIMISSLKSTAIAINWDSGGDGTSWIDSLNWDCNCLPGVADAVTISYSGNNGLDMNAANENAIYNLGTMHRSGFFNANNITGSTIKNEGVFNNNDNLFINAFGLPGWFVENLYGGIINNNAGQTWTFPIPGSFYNVSDMGLVNHSGATFNNYGTLQFFGHRIAGSGAFVSYTGSTVEGCAPGLGCP